jgi:cbb3-type cytochrome oxidase subunit 3
MNTLTKTSEKEAMRTPVKMMLSALWVTLMFLYIYADFFSLYRPGKMEEVMAGRMGPFPVTQATLLQASILMLIPAFMVFLTLALKPRVGRWANMILGVLYTAVNIGNLVGETWAFYILYGILEMALTLLIVGYAWKWRNSEGQP